MSEGIEPSTSFEMDETEQPCLSGFVEECTRIRRAFWALGTPPSVFYVLRPDLQGYLLVKTLADATGFIVSVSWSGQLLAAGGHEVRVYDAAQARRDGRQGEGEEEVGSFRAGASVFLGAFIRICHVGQPARLETCKQRFVQRQALSNRECVLDAALNQMEALGHPVPS